MSKQTKTATPETAEKRPVGRPASFPGMDKSELAMFAANIPVATREGLKALASQRELPLNMVLNTILEQAINKAAKDRARRAARKSS